MAKNSKDSKIFVSLILKKNNQLLDSHNLIITPKEMKKQFEIYAQLFKQHYLKIKNTIDWTTSIF